MRIYPYWIALNIVSIWSFHHYMSVYSPKDIKRKFCQEVLSSPRSPKARSPKITQDHSRLPKISKALKVSQTYLKSVLKVSQEYPKSILKVSNKYPNSFPKVWNLCFRVHSHMGHIAQEHNKLTRVSLLFFLFESNLHLL